MTFLLRLIALLILSVFISIEAFSQICGVVRDVDTGEPIEGAIVGFQDIIVVSDASGFFNIKLSALGESPDSMNSKNNVLWIDHVSYTLKELNGPWINCDNIFMRPQAFKIQTLTISGAYMSDSIFRIPGAYGISKPGDWLNAAGFNVLDAVDALPGAQVQKGALNTQRITVRGIGSRSPFSSNRIKAYFSGIPISGGDGETEIEDFDAALIHNIELIKGPKSALYGAGLGGTVFLNPPRFLIEGWHANINTAIGSHGLFRNSLGVSHSDTNQMTLAGFSSHAFSGWRDNSEYERQNMHLWHSRNLGPGELQFIFNYRNLYAEIPSSLNLNDFVNTPDKAADNWASISGYEDNKKMLAAIKYSMDLSNHLTINSALFYQSYSGLERRPFNTLDDRNSRWGTRSFIQWTAERFSAKAGLELLSEAYEWMTYETLEQGRGNAINHFYEKRLPFNVFLNANLDLSPKFKLESGVSYNALKYSVEDRSGFVMLSSNTYTYPAYLAYFSGLSYEWTENKVLYASLGSGLSYPSLQETLLPGGAVNPDIQSETGINAEIGGRFYLFGKSFFADICLYKIWVEDMLLTLRLPNGDSFGDNGGSATYQGIELLTKANIFRRETGLLRSMRFVYLANYSSNRFTDFTDDSGIYDGNRLPGLPNFISMLAAELDFGSRIQLKAEHRHQSSQFLDDANSVDYSGFDILNAGLSYNLKLKKQKELGISVNVNNVLNNSYASMVLVNAPSFGNNDPRYYYPAQPISWTVLLNYRL